MTNRGEGQYGRPNWVASSPNWLLSLSYSHNPLVGITAPWESWNLCTSAVTILVVMLNDRVKRLQYKTNYWSALKDLFQERHLNRSYSKRFSSFIAGAYCVTLSVNNALSSYIDSCVCKFRWESNLII